MFRTLLAQAAIAAVCSSCLLLEYSHAQSVFYDNMQVDVGNPVGPRSDDNRDKEAQQFLTGLDDNVASISLTLQKVGSPRGEVSVQIWTESGNGVPGTNLGTIGAFDVATLSHSPQRLTLNGVVDGLLPDTAYFVLFDNSATNINSFDNTYRHGITDDLPEGTNGAAKVMSSSPDVSNGDWLLFEDPRVLGCHPVFGCPSYLQMQVASAETDHVKLYDNTGFPNSGVIGPRWNDNLGKGAQQFLTGDSDNVSGLSINLQRVGSPKGEAIVEIWDQNESGQPGNRVATVGSVDIASLSTGSELVNFDSLLTGLDPHSAYYVVLNNDQAVLDFNNTYRDGVRGHVDDEQNEGTGNASTYLTRDSDVGEWYDLDEAIGCHPPTGNCANFMQMSITSAKTVGDFDLSGALDVADIDRLSDQIRTDPSDRSFDLNNDAVLNHEDYTTWVHDRANTYFGDANLDGEFNSGDLTAVFKAAKYELDGEAGWAEGDWTGDGRFDTADLTAAFQDGGYERGSRTAVVAVPEPSGWILLSLGLIGVGRMRRQH